MLDPQLLAELHRGIAEPWVFITGDDRLPFEHADVVAEHSTTIATLGGQWMRICERAGVVPNQDEFKHETVQRWAHVMSTQPQGSIRRYSILGHSNWRPRRRFT